MWLKNNSQYTFGDRSVRNFEPIFHFTKSANHYYDSTWLESFVDEKNDISFGTTGIKPKIISAIDFRDGVLQSNGSNTLELRRKCAEKGFFMEHSCTFPIDLPLICVLSTTRPGDTVLDLFNGTATTGEVCVLTDRKYVGYELNPQFVMASEVRLSNYELGQVA
jgi:DNA modification methylase